MTALNPYLSFDGNAEEAMNFYAASFGTSLATIMRWGENPQCEGMSDTDKNKVMHAALPVGDSMIMASDFVAMPGMEYKAGTNFAVAIGPETREEADRLFGALSGGGNVTCPMMEMFWGGYFGSFTDKFGVAWLINQGGGQQT
jgi:PhnB protein